MESIQALTNMNDSISKQHCVKQHLPDSALNQSGIMNTIETVNIATGQDNFLVCTPPTSGTTKHQKSRELIMVPSTSLHLQPTQSMLAACEPSPERERQALQGVIEELREMMREVSAERDDIWADAVLVSDNNDMLMRDLEDVENRNKVMGQDTKSLRTQLNDALLIIEQQDMSLGAAYDLWDATDYEVAIGAMNKRMNRKVRAVNDEKKELEKLMRHHEEEAEIAREIARAATERSNGLQNTLKSCAFCCAKSKKYSAEQEKGKEACKSSCKFIKEDTSGDNTNEGGSRASRRLSFPLSKLRLTTNTKKISVCQVKQAENDRLKGPGGEFILPGKRDKNAETHSGSNEKTKSASCISSHRTWHENIGQRATSRSTRRADTAGRRADAEQREYPAFGIANEQQWLPLTSYPATDVQESEDESTAATLSDAAQGGKERIEEIMKKYGMSLDSGLVKTDPSKHNKYTCKAGARKNGCALDDGVIVNDKNSETPVDTVGGESCVVVVGDIDELTIDTCHDAENKSAGNKSQGPIVSVCSAYSKASSRIGKFIKRKRLDNDHVASISRPPSSLTENGGTSLMERD
jgi:hypothetical protein